LARALRRNPSKCAPVEWKNKKLNVALGRMEEKHPEYHRGQRLHQGWMCSDVIWEKGSVRSCACNAGGICHWPPLFSEHAQEKNWPRGIGQWSLVTRDRGTSGHPTGYHGTQWIFLKSLSPSQSLVRHNPWEDNPHLQYR